MNQNTRNTENTVRQSISQLREPFDFKDLGWKIQVRANEGKSGLAVAYVDSRAIQRRLDEVAGPFGWRNEYLPWHGNSQLCGISIYDADSKAWITKYDGAENTDIEPIKGGLSDAFKRAAVLWGIGRYIYEMDGVWVDVEPVGKNGAKVKKSEYGKLEKAYNQVVAQLFGAQATEQQVNQVPQQPVPQQPVPQPMQMAAKPATQSAAKSTGKAAPVAPTKKTPAAPIFTIKTATQNGNSTLLELVAGDGEVVTAYAKNSSVPLTAGANLHGVSIEQRTNANGLYNILSSYQLAA